MRLDKFLTEQTDMTRSIAGREIRRGEVTVNGEVVKNSALKLQPDDKVEYNGHSLEQQTGPRYFMLHKPQGYVCSTDDPDHPTVLFLLEEPASHKLHPAGRLDIDTTGLVLLTDDGQWSHRITSPRHHCEKTYLVTLADPVDASAIALFAEGVQLRSEPDLTRPAVLELLGSHQARLTITEGKYHQVKRMFAAIGNKVTALHRECVGGIALDSNLAEGEYRRLTDDEVQRIVSQ
ncbi:MAG: 16S rRNA pseudouridine(516) synthase RsuA [Plesiomonas sp.]|uniref:16S rRNA pseudouridine(516) synthase RsuA n=1 Tax=Plesiomonas sp. TaxID=2486279 RepID=UPI003EE4FF82